MAEFGVPHHIRTKAAMKELFRNPQRVFHPLSPSQWNQRLNTRQAEKAVANIPFTISSSYASKISSPFGSPVLHALDVANQTAIHWACESIHRDLVLGRYPSKRPYVMHFGDRPVLSVGYQQYWHDFLRNELDPQLEKPMEQRAPVDFLRRLWKFADTVPLVSENQSGLRYGISATYQMCYVYGSLWPKDDPMNKVVFPGQNMVPTAKNSVTSTVTFKKTLPHTITLLVDILEGLHLWILERLRRSPGAHLPTPGARTCHLTERNQKNLNLEIST